MKFKNKIFFITGGAIGIGRSTSLKIANLGGTVVISDINKEKGLELVNDILAQGLKADFFQLDVSKSGDVEKVISKVVNIHGRIDFAINNAGISGRIASLHELTQEDWNKIIGVNLSGVFYCLKEEIKVMLNQGGGGIVNVASLAGLQGMGGGSVYSASKHGVVSLSKTAAIEYGKHNIRVNSVCPSFIETDILNSIPESILDFSTKHRVPMKRLGQPDEVAESIVWLLNDKSSYVNGHSLVIDGGMYAGG